MRLQIIGVHFLLWLFPALAGCLLDSTIHWNTGGSGGSGGLAGAGGQGGSAGTGGEPIGGNGGTSVGGSAGQGGMGASAGQGGFAGVAGNGGGGSGPVCGDNTKEGSEVCDGIDLDSQDCGSIPGGYTSGALACLPDCSGFDTTTCVSPPPTCLAGTTNGTVDTITASGAIETGFLLHHGDGSEYYSSMVPTMDTFTGEELPGQLALYGKEGIQFDLQNGAIPVSMSFYKVDDFGTLPSPQCDGAALKSQACLSLVAKSFRCQFAPYNEAFSCPPDVSFVEPVESPSDFYQDLSAGNHLLVVDLLCP